MVRVLDVVTQDAIRFRGELSPRNFVVLTRTGGTVTGFWEGPETVVTNIVSGEDGMVVSRTFVGDGAILKVDPVPMRIGLEVRTIQIAMSGLHPDVLSFTNQADARFAKVEIYRGLLSPTGQLVSMPRIRWLGKLNGAPLSVGGSGQETKITMRVVSHTRELTRTNPAKKSHVQQQKRSGDQFHKYVGVAGEWKFWWGEEKSDD